jgi:hypothetical protein
MLPILLFQFIAERESQDETNQADEAPILQRLHVFTA